MEGKEQRKKRRRRDIRDKGDRERRRKEGGEQAARRIRSPELRFWDEEVSCFNTRKSRDFVTASCRDPDSNIQPSTVQQSPSS